MANRPKQNRAEQDDAPNMKMVKPPEGGIHSTVGKGVSNDPPTGNQDRQG